MININAVCTVCNSNIPIFDIDTENQIRIKSKIACCGVEVVIVGEPKENLGYLNENDLTLKAQKNQNHTCVESQEKDHGEEIPFPPKGEKKYTVIIDYIRITDNDARTKLAIITNILKKSHAYKSNPPK